MTELDSLYKELEEVKKYPGEYLPQYGYSPKKDIIELIEEDIIEEKEKLTEKFTDDDGMDYANLCRVLGLSY